MAKIILIMNISTSSLFHYTPRSENIISILKVGLIPNFCREEFISSHKIYVIGIPMVCFCDIPLTRSQEFRDRYGKYAISFRKEWAIRKGGNPVLYVRNERIFNSLLYYMSSEKAAEKSLRDRGMTADGRLNSLNILSQQNMDIMKDFINYHNEKEANRILFGFAITYNNQRNGHEQTNYFENEWRYVVDESPKACVKWLYGSEEYKQWRGKGTKPKPPESIMEKKLTFSINDITHIIVDNDTEIVSLSKEIQLLDVICGKRLTDVDRMLLLTKILSIERLVTDF